MVKRNQSGHVLIVALFVIATTLAATAMIAASLGYEMWLVRQQAQDLRLTTLADSAMAMTLAEFSVNHGYRGTRGTIPFDGGTIAIDARQTSLNTAQATLWVTYGGGRRAAFAELELRPLQVTHWEPIAFEDPE